MIIISQKAVTKSKSFCSLQNRSSKNHLFNSPGKPVKIKEAKEDNI